MNILEKIINDKKKEVKLDKIKNPIDQLKKKVSNKKTWQLIKPYLSEINHPDGVSMSEKHANFLINTQTKSSNIIEDFGEMVRNKVLEKTGIKLDKEIKILE